MHNYNSKVPRRIDSVAAKKHKIKTNIQWRTPRNDFTIPHVGKEFWLNSNDLVNSVAGYFGPTNVIYIQLDNKAKVNIGKIPAKQTR